MSVIEVLLRLSAATVTGYLLGSLPSGVLIGKVFGNVDPRSQGSGKTGATNILRALGPGPAALVVVMDVGKGVVAVLLARFLFFPLASHPTVNEQVLQALAEALAGLAALLGHNRSIFIHFTGGRGVATGAGVILVMSPLVFLVGLIALIIPILITRYVSLGSIFGAFCCAVGMVVLTLTGHYYWPYALYGVVASAFIILSHHDNIQRILSGTERQIGSSTHSQPVH
ncbi:MAG: glycerol-3-phosphate 1-O-acyltransferase PlsY [Ktedonobacterales bacterium]